MLKNNQKTPRKRTQHLTQTAEDKTPRPTTQQPWNISRRYWENPDRLQRRRD